MPSHDDYSWFDRWLHRLALARPGIQVGMAEVENDLHGKTLARVPDGGEVVVTGLARSGTTLLLELLHGTGEFACYTYRHMPFIVAPLLWDRISRPFRRRAVARERAHGDGVSVSYDSPEAFEEVVWLAHLRDRFVRDDHLDPLTTREVDREFVAAYRASVRKCRLLAVGDGDPARAPRYLAKNNADLSRLGLLAELIPAGRIVIPFRDPRAHVGSLMAQHALFTERHADDRFSRQYMEWLGHFEFGEALRPIDYGGWLADEPRPRRVDAGFWLRYWTAAYRHALAEADERAILVDFDALLADGRPQLGRLARRLELDRPERLIQTADRLRAPTSRPAETQDMPADDLAAATAVHAELRERSG
ncbi:hypothetical protein GF314_13485 [bacterium]|nr:hypothetical protein [bacterium]